MVPEGIYLKNPDSSELGIKIIVGAIDLIHELGFEAFNFRRLSAHINTTEASIYRYFESKYKLLLYITAWYWGWLDYRLLIGTANILDPKEKLKRAIQIVTENIENDSTFQHISENKLHHIVITESSKAYLTRQIEDHSEEGVFGGYKQIIERIADIILEVNPQFKYAKMLVSTCIEGAHLQRFFGTNLPMLTDSVNTRDLKNKDRVSDFFELLIMRTISSN